MEFPVWAFLTCADIFDAMGETESFRAAVKAGYNKLMARAETLSDPEWRLVFMQSKKERRHFVAWWERLQR